jgi:deoxyribodipyrimidine photo-lyase
MITGLKEVEASLRSKGIPFHLMMGDPTYNIPAFVKEQDAIMLVSDFSPLRV